MSETPATSPDRNGPQTAYQVLARKYRPRNFAELIGQDAVVKTLSNAIEADRLAHAWLLSGARGVGKTTTARILARALNCIGADGKGGPTPNPCGACANCTAIGDDRHPDVIEMDAASRTGVDDIRELIESVRYRPVTARYKIYIIDEVHMLTNNAFNALLKTLEEPPEHVKFIFATTESRKLPVTVLSRCQRFDLRLVSEEDLTRHFTAVAEAEGVTLDPAAARLVARAADGSVRDGLSILDQAVAGAGAGTDNDNAINEDMVRAMLGLADRAQVFDLFEAMMKGDIATALDLMAEGQSMGADAESVMADLLDLTHWLTRVKVTPSVADDPVVPEAERITGRRLAEALTMPLLARAWQMLLKGLGEVQTAPQPMKAAEMVLVRLAYAADLPTPADLVARLANSAPASPAAQPTSKTSSQAPMPAQNPPQTRPTPARPGAQARPEPAPAPEPETAPEPASPPTAALPTSFTAMIELLDKHREGRLTGELKSLVHLVRYEPGRVEFRPAPGADKTLANRLGTVLMRLTDARWTITLSSEAGAPTLAEQASSAAKQRRREAGEHPLVKAALEAFPGAKIVEVREAADSADAAPLPDPDAYGDMEPDSFEENDR